jgi:hypothetical protein
MEFIPNILKKVSCWIEPRDGIFFKKKNHENLFNEFPLQNNNVSDFKFLPVYSELKDNCFL